eukprot:Gregarina_sp_Poly_1__11513@NODE_997_length_5425_cov_18_355543_g699_i0_p1_GENE_NODE_997_length_5425_cov_18_355543_g699_i0NODE_997_length_5425_cov_18_355543_g699_i0_p1_ORF_typecomplete_len1293_score156_81Gryzunlike/PF12742_7/2e05Gryzun/PF07919_12/0_056TRAPPC10/PF12584_8/6_2e03TRAPPC10/PF12584_8/0_34_NODE_997_length_5425_cov_18_355543_g699_i02044082
MLQLTLKMEHGMTEFHSGFERVRKFVTNSGVEVTQFRVLKLLTVSQLYRFASKLLSQSKAFQKTDADSWWDPLYHLESSLVYLCECRALMSQQSWQESAVSGKEKSYELTSPKYLGHLPFAITDAPNVFYDLRIRCLCLHGKPGTAHQVQFYLPFPFTAAAFSEVAILNMIIAVATQVCQRRLQSSRVMPSSMTNTILRAVDELFHSHAYNLAFKFYAILSCPVMYDSRKSLKKAFNNSNDLVCPFLSMRFDACRDSRGLMSLPPLSFDEPLVCGSFQQFSNFYLHQLIGFGNTRIPRMEIPTQASGTAPRHTPAIGYLTRCRALFALLKLWDIEVPPAVVKLVVLRKRGSPPVQTTDLLGNPLRVFLDAILRIHLLVITHKVPDLPRTFIDRMLLFVTSDNKFSHDFLSRSFSEGDSQSVQVASANLLALPDPQSCLWIAWNLIVSIRHQLLAQNNQKYSWHLGLCLQQPAQFLDSLDALYRTLVAFFVPRFTSDRILVMPPVPNYFTGKCAISTGDHDLLTIWIQTKLPSTLMSYPLIELVCEVDDRNVTVDQFEFSNTADGLCIIRFAMGVENLRPIRFNTHLISPIILIFQVRGELLVPLELNALEPVLLPKAPCQSDGPMTIGILTPVIPAAGRPRTYRRLQFRSPIDQNVSAADNFQPRKVVSCPSLFIRESGRPDLSMSVAWLPATDNPELIPAHKFPIGVALRVRVTKSFLPKLVDNLTLEGSYCSVPTSQATVSDSLSARIQQATFSVLGMQSASLQYQASAEPNLGSVLAIIGKSLMEQRDVPGITLVEFSKQDKLLRHYWTKSKIPLLNGQPRSTASSGLASLAIIEWDEGNEIGFCIYCQTNVVPADRLQLSITLKSSFEIIEVCSTDLLRLTPNFKATVLSVNPTLVPETEQRPLSLNKLRLTLHPAQEGLQGCIISCYISTPQAPSNVFQYSNVPARFSPDSTSEACAEKWPDLETFQVHPNQNLVSIIAMSDLHRLFDLNKFINALLEFQNDKDYFCNFGRAMVDYILAEELKLAERKLDPQCPFYVFLEVAVDQNRKDRMPFRNSETGKLIFPIVAMNIPISWKDVLEMTALSSSLRQFANDKCAPTIFKNPAPFFQYQPLVISAAVLTRRMTKEGEPIAIVGEPIKWHISLENLTERVLMTISRVFVFPNPSREGQRNPIKILSTPESFIKAPNLDVKTFLVDGDRMTRRMLLPRAQEIIRYTLVPLKSGNQSLPLFGIAIQSPTEGLHLYPVLHSVKDALTTAQAPWPKSSVFWSRRSELLVHTHYNEDDLLIS